MTSLLDQTIDMIARARAPKEPPRPAGPIADLDPHLERPHCPLCGGTRGKVELVGKDDWVPDTYRARSYAVVRCEICTGRYTSPRYRREHRALAFAKGYPFYGRAEGVKDGSLRDDSHARQLARKPFEGRAARLVRHCPRPGRLLDLGCGDGFFLEVMRDRGWDVAGADSEDVVIWHAREKLGLANTHVLDVENDELPEGPFDAITMWGMLQLAYRPQRLLEKARALLAPGGVLAIGVSNAKSLGAMLFGSRWRGLGMPRHLVHFTPETLVRLVEWSGFEALALVHETPRWIVAGSVDATLPRLFLSRPFAMVGKATLYATGALVGSTRFGDTMELYARRGA